MLNEHLEHLEHLAHLERTIAPRFTDSELQVPRLPRISCRELRLHPLHVVLFQKNHISGRGVREEKGNPGTLGMTARKAWRLDREWLRMLRPEKIEATTSQDDGFVGEAGRQQFG